MKLLILAMGLMLNTGNANADWTHPVTYPVTYMEVLFGCTGLSPDLSVAPTVNIRAGQGQIGELRLPAGALALAENSIVPASDTGSARPRKLGTLSNTPTCQVDDAGETPHPTWNAITLSPSATIQLTFDANVPSCRYDSADGEYLRTNLYTLTVQSESEAPYTLSWQETGNYASPTACRTLP